MARKRFLLDYYPVPTILKLAQAHSVLNCHNNHRRAYDRGDLKAAQEFQSKTVGVIDTFSSYPGLSIQKDILALTGVEYGPMRLPQVGLTGAQRAELAEVLKGKGMNITSAV